MLVLLIFCFDDGCLLLQIFCGGQFSVNEIVGLIFYVGQFCGNSLCNDVSMQDMLLFGWLVVIFDCFDFVGGEYCFNGECSLFGLWNVELKDIYC